MEWSALCCYWTIFAVFQTEHQLNTFGAVLVLHASPFPIPFSRAKKNTHGPLPNRSIQTARTAWLLLNYCRNVTRSSDTSTAKQRREFCLLLQVSDQLDSYWYSGSAGCSATRANFINQICRQASDLSNQPTTHASDGVRVTVQGTSQAEQRSRPAMPKTRSKKAHLAAARR